jgi:hypothetical protein
MQRHRRPGQVERAEIRPGGVQVRLDSADPVGEPALFRLAAQPLKRVRLDVNRGHRRAGEALGEAERAGAGARAEVEQPDGR